MARFIVFAADLKDIIARSSGHDRIGWAERSDRDSLIALGAKAAWLDWALNDSDTPIVVAKIYGRVIGYYAITLRNEIRQSDWLIVSSKTHHDILGLYGFVIPEYRGRGILGRMKGFAAQLFRESGYRRLISLVRAQNRASLRAQAHAGAVPLVTVSRVRIGKLMFIWEGHNLRRVSLGKTKPLVVTV